MGVAAEVPLHRRPLDLPAMCRLSKPPARTRH